MAWKVNKTGAKIADGWLPNGKDKVAQANWNTFMNAVNKGTHPATAGSGMQYKMLNKSTGQAQIRLTNGGERASFIVDEKKEEINKIQLGGHT